MYYHYRKPRLHLAAVAVTVLLFSSAPYAADKSAGSADHGHAASQKGGMSGPSMQMHQSMMKGMKEMQGMKPSGSMDHDFAMMMRHHHLQGIEMAQFELKHGKDAKMREMAQKIMDSQKREIAEFDEWMKSTGHSKGKK